MIPPNFNMKDYFNLKGIIKNENTIMISQEDTFIFDSPTFTSYRIKQINTTKCTFEDINQLTKSKVGYQIIKEDQDKLQEVNIMYTSDTKRETILQETNQIIKKCK